MLNNMLILEPIKYGTYGAAKALDFDWLSEDGGEANIIPSSGDASAKGKIWLANNMIGTEDTYVDFTKYFTDLETTIFYAVSYIYMPTERPIKLLVSSDDGVKVWWNHEAVHRNAVGRGINLETPDIVEVTGKAGYNQITIKIQNGTGSTGFRVICGLNETEEYSDLQYGIIPPIPTDSTPMVYNPTLPTTQNTQPAQNAQNQQWPYNISPTIQYTQQQQYPTQQQTTETPAPGNFLEDTANDLGIEKQWLIIGAVALVIIAII